MCYGKSRMDLGSAFAGAFMEHPSSASYVLSARFIVFGFEKEC